MSEEEAKYFSDKSTFENPDFRSYCNKNYGGLPKELSQTGLKFYRVLQENYKKWIEENKLSLENLHTTYKDLLYIEDTNRIDVVLAVALSSKLEGIPLWLILVGPSGDMKSVQLNAIRGPNVEVMHNLTSKTLVNGFKDKKKFPDFAPRLNNKIVIVPDMAQILKLPPNEKGELWGQLRDLYDGLAGKNSGMGSTARYEGLKITLLAGSTPAIDAQVLVHQDLGTRELIYRTTGSKNKIKVMEKCFENEDSEKEITETLKRVTMQFIDQTQIRLEEVPPNILKEIENIATYIIYMRSTAEFDNYTNELRNFVYPEEPTRIAKQLKRLYVCLKSLDENYPNEKALEILWHVGRSSAFPVRIKLFELLLKSKVGFSTSQLSEFLKIGKSTAKREALVLEHLNILTCKRDPVGGYSDKFYEFWKINKENDFVKSLIDTKPSINVIENMEDNSSNTISLDGKDIEIIKC